MKARKSLASRLPGVTFSGDVLQRLHVRFEERALVFKPHFLEACEAWLARTLSLSPDADLAFAAIAAELVIDPEELPGFLCSLKDAFLSQGKAWVIWKTRDGRPDARRLSDLTVACIGRLEGKWPTNWDAALEDLGAAIGAAVPRLRLRSASSGLSSLQAFLRGAAAAATDLSGIYLHHLLGLQRMTPPERGTFALIESGRPVAPSADDANAEDGQATQVSEAIEALVVEVGISEGDYTIDFELLHQVQEALSNKVQGGYGKQRRLALDEILRRMEKSVSGHTTLVLAFAAHLLTVGTLKRKRASMRNVRAYFKAICTALKWDPQVLHMLMSDDMDEAYQGYQRLLSSSSAKGKEARKELRKATGAFRAYLIHRFDAHAVPLGPNPSDSDSAIPVSLLLDEGSKERLIALIKSSIENVRVREIALCMLHLALDVPVRISDLWRLRIADVVSSGQTLVVQFRAHRNEDRPKTRASVGAIAVRQPIALHAMKAWQERRDTETVDLNQPFFGDGFGKPTLTQAMLAYKALNRLLKAVLGDRRASFHTLRHTAISNDANAALCSNSASLEVDPLHEVSSRARHATTATTIRTYTHLYAEGMRLAIDSLLFSMMTHRAVARWAQLNESTLSKRARGRDIREVWAEALRAIACRVPLPSAEQGLDLAPASELQQVPRKVTLQDLLLILECFGKGESATQVATRSGLSESLCAAIQFEWAGLKGRGIGPIEELHWGTPKLSGLVSVVGGAPAGELCRRAAEACMNLAVGEYLDATSASSIDPVLRLLRHAQYPPGLLLARCDREEAPELQEVLHLFALRFGAHPGGESVKPERTRRPGVYLMLLSQPVKEGETAGPRNACTKGLTDLLAAAFIYQRVVADTNCMPKPAPGEKHEG